MQHNSRGDEFFMAQAIRLARKGWYTTHPNPRVGCVLVDDNKVIGRGWHEYAGQGHAEVNALRQAGDRARGATAYVTLEPCSHYGKTPPCSNALIDAGIRRVVVAMIDPNPLVAGQGLQRLRENGIEVSSGILELEARDLNPGFIQRMGLKRPFIRCKMAMSLDGRTALANGESKWITSENARADVQRLRAESSAILTGIGTVLADDPSMNVRDTAFGSANRQPDRVVLDTWLRMPTAARMLSLAGETVIITSASGGQKQLKRQAFEQMPGVKLFTIETGNKHLSLPRVNKILAQRQYNEVLLEAGATLTGAMLQEKYIDELIIYMAPHLLGSQARGLFNLPGLESMSDRINLDISDIRAVGKDYRITARVDWH